MDVVCYESNANWYEGMENRIKIEQRSSEIRGPQNNCRYPFVPLESSSGPINSVYHNAQDERKKKNPKSLFKF